MPWISSPQSYSLSDKGTFEQIPEVNESSECPGETILRREEQVQKPCLRKVLSIFKAKKLWWLEQGEQGEENPKVRLQTWEIEETNHCGILLSTVRLSTFTLSERKSPEPLELRSDGI